MSRTVKWREGIQLDLDLTLDKIKVRFDWTDWLAEIGVDAISTALFFVESGLVKSGDTVTSPYADIIVNCDTGGSAPTVGSVLKLTCQVTTTGGQTKGRSIDFLIKDYTG